MSDDQLSVSDDTRQFVKIPEAARMLSLCRSYVYQAMTSGKLPYYQFGRSRRLSVEDLKKFIENSRRGGENFDD